MEGVGLGEPLQTQGLNPVEVPSVPHLMASIPASLSFCMERHVRFNGV